MTIIRLLKGILSAWEKWLKAQESEESSAS